LEHWESVLRRFEQGWAAGLRPALEDCLPPPGDRGRVAVLVELVQLELEFRLKAGEPARVEDYLGRVPELAAADQAVLGCAQAEREFRRRREPFLPPDEYRRRFPQLAGRFDDDTLAWSPAASAPAAPPVKRLGKYELLEVIGEGAFGVVWRG